MPDEIYNQQENPQPRLPRKQMLYALAGLLVVLIAAAAVWFFVFHKKETPATNNANQNAAANVNVSLPENHTITDDERKQLGIDAGLEGEIKYTLVNGSVVSYFDITKDNRPKDTDGDALSDTDEAKYKSDPKNSDTDGDRWSDGYEVKQGCDPTKLDTDGDGIPDYEEYTVYHTSCSKTDTDEDGLTDSQEINTYHSDPLKADTDNDGNSDGTEVKNGYNPNGSGKLPS